jgi:ectoine hydroxylase
MASIMSAAEIVAFNTDGFFIVRGMYDAEEVDLLRRAMQEDPEVASHMLDRLDAHGAATRIALWNRAGDSVYGMAARCERMVDTMEALLGGPVYHFQSKLTAKQPFVGGAWEWHQDYGCLQMVRGSHLLGRIDHVPVPGEGQNVADPARMKDIVARLEIVPCELEPGDAVFFHSNTLHRSDQNRSPHRRWTLICCYNRVDNDTLVRDHDRYYVKLDKVPDSAVTAAGLRFAGGDEHFTSRPFVPKLA